MQRAKSRSVNPLLVVRTSNDSRRKSFLRVLTVRRCASGEGCFVVGVQVAAVEAHQRFVEKTMSHDAASEAVILSSWRTDWRRQLHWCTHGHPIPSPRVSVDGSRCDICDGAVTKQECLRCGICSLALCAQCCFGTCAEQYRRINCDRARTSDSGGNCSVQT